MTTQKDKAARDCAPATLQNTGTQNDTPMVLATEINAEHQAAFGKAREALEHARRAGELLLLAKAEVEHGQWKNWLTVNITFSERTAQAYMSVAREWPAIEAKAQTSADLSVNRALALLTDTTSTRKKTVTKNNVTTMYPAATGEHIHHQDHVHERDDDGEQDAEESEPDIRPAGGFSSINVTKPLRQPPLTFSINTPTTIEHLVTAWDGASIETRKRLFRTRPKEIQDTINAVNTDGISTRRAAV